MTPDINQGAGDMTDTVKTKIVEHIVGNALHALKEAQGEAANMRDRYPNLLADHKNEGVGLDFAVLREKLEEAAKLLELLV